MTDETVRHFAAALAAIHATELNIVECARRASLAHPDDDEAAAAALDVDELEPLVRQWAALAREINVARDRVEDELIRCAPLRATASSTTRGPE